MAGTTLLLLSSHSFLYGHLKWSNWPHPPLSWAKCGSFRERWLGHGTANSHANRSFCGAVGLFVASLWKYTGRCWAVTETPLVLCVCIGIEGNAAEGSNAHVCLDSSAWCHWCLRGRGIHLFLWLYPKVQVCPNFCRVGQWPLPAEQASILGYNVLVLPYFILHFLNK